MTFFQFGNRVLDTGNHIGNVLVGQTRMHGQIGFPFVEEFGGNGALVGIVAHAAQAGEVEGGLIVQNGLDAFFLIEDLHEFVAAGPSFFSFTQISLDVIYISVLFSIRLPSSRTTAK